MSPHPSGASAGAGGISVIGTLAGLPASTAEAAATGGWHIHTGSTCDAPVATANAAVGGHYYPDMATDPWNAITYAQT
ncbi:MAG: hypothetical protein VX017_11255, partial [Pseudomonadota bacterium]|nr:hypothetical protein [Pseudomonadota bacterium]